nr:c-type cytochrome biogenesis protein CcmI [Betaproteobacteria bacterium]
MAASPLFWALALALVGATLAALVWPLFRGRRDEARGDKAAAAAQGDDAAATAIFRDYQRQIDADYTAGLIDSGERETAMAELVTRLGGELAQVEPERNALHARSQRVA